MSEQSLALRYFEMWNSGDTSAASEILHAEWVDHGHPEVAGPVDVVRAVEEVRAARPGLAFAVEAVLGGDGEQVAVVGDADGVPLVWVFRVRDGRLAELRTFRGI